MTDGPGMFTSQPSYEHEDPNRLKRDKLEKDLNDLEVIYFSIGVWHPEHTLFSNCVCPLIALTREPFIYATEMERKYGKSASFWRDVAESYDVLAADVGPFQSKGEGAYKLVEKHAGIEAFLAAVDEMDVKIPY